MPAVTRLARPVDPARPLRVLDAGCGEGKNTTYITRQRQDAEVLAVDLSPSAISNARAWCRVDDRVQWLVADIENVAYNFPDDHFDVIIAYGLMHCLRGEPQIHRLIREHQRATAPGGIHVLVAFNSRNQDMALAHPGFDPMLLPHAQYLQVYEDAGFDILQSSDQDLRESHPNNNIMHLHSMTRLIAQRPANL